MGVTNAKVNRVMIAGTGSGCGKTTVTCAILQALKNRGLDVGAAKCGPDYIDPMFHRSVIGAPSTNLDPFFFDDNTLRFLLAKNGQSRALTVIEGVMGYYDGLGLTSPRAGAYDLARKTETPVILTVNAKGASLSVLAQIKGFLSFVPESNIRGVILNNCTEKVYSALAPMIETELRIRPLGYLPRMAEAEIGSRHLGLVTADEITDLKERLSRLAGQAEKSLDIDGILGLAKSASELEFEPIAIEKREPVRLAVARDAAFCFYYEDSLDLLRQMGAEIVPFSPLEDERLPEGVNGLYLGGGYPELYKDALSANSSMRESVKTALEGGLPCVAECGGFMYLTEEIGGAPMVGFIKGRSFDRGRLTRFGYVTLTANEDNMLCEKGESIPAHEFHHWDAEDAGASFTAGKPDGRGWTCVHAGETLYAGFPHIHFYAEPRFAERFYTAMLEGLGFPRGNSVISNTPHPSPEGDAFPAKGKAGFAIIKPMEIEKRSFEIISGILAEQGVSLDPENEPVIKRVIHTTADFDYVKTLVFSEGAVRLGIEALKSGCDIVTDTQMAKSGINKSILAKLGGEVHCFMSDEDVAKEAKERGITRAAVSMEKAAKLDQPLIFAIGNAPTALIALDELMKEGKLIPKLIIGVPVGFVNVVESKELIIASSVPHIVARGRKGGSNVAAAIVNALLYSITR